MTDLFKKLNLKDQSPVAILNSPASFEDERMATAAETLVHTELQAGVRYPFTLVFAGSQAELGPRAREVIDQTTDEAVLWFAYPKKTSKAFKSDLNRDVVWQVLEPLGLAPNRQVAIDDDWSALRFKKD